MVRYPESRYTRRLKAREELRRRLEEIRPPRHPLGDPRIDEDRRQQERRANAMTPKEVEDWLKRNGMQGTDRRKAERRQGDRRR